jgi:hypothetical protein
LNDEPFTTLGIFSVPLAKQMEVLFIGFNGLTALVTRRCTFWDIMPYSPLKLK